MLTAPVLIQLVTYTLSSSSAQPSNANAVGEVIAELSATMQVIDITHLPQIASKGDRHYLVYKSESTTNMRQLTDSERITEIAKMLSGENITDAAIKQAQILLGK